MAQGDKFQLAIAYPVANHSFALQNKITMLLSSAYSSGTNLEVDTVVSDMGSTDYDWLNHLFRAGDRIQVGPSLVTADLGDSESSIISSIGSISPASEPLTEKRKFVLNSALSKDYADNDKVTGVGSALAGAWYLEGNALTGATGDALPTVDVETGFFNNYAQRIRVFNTDENTLFDSGVTTLPLNLVQNLDSNLLFDDTAYRFGFHHKFTDASLGSLNKLWQVQVGSVNTNIGITTDITSFTSVVSTLIAQTWASSPTISFALTDPGTGTMTAWIDEVYLEHTFGNFTKDDSSLNSDKRTTIGSGNGGFDAGYYAFTEDPDQGSIKVNKRKSIQEISFPGGKKSWADISGEGDRFEKYDFTCSFSDVSQGFYDILLEFERIQAQGHTLNIHPNVDDLPPVIRGKMTLGQVEKNFWDLSLRSFSFQFQEA